MNCDYTWKLAESEGTDKDSGVDNPDLGWLNLFATTADLLSNTTEIDSSAAIPSNCKKESAQYIAWLYGQMAGNFTRIDNRWHDDPFLHFREFADTALLKDDAFEWAYGPE